MRLLTFLCLAITGCGNLPNEQPEANAPKLTLEEKREATYVQQTYIVNAIKGYYLKNNRFPERLDDLVKKPKDFTEWKGPLLDAPDLPKDKWGRDFKMKITAPKNPREIRIEVRSAAQDGKFGTDDDIVIAG